MRIEYLDKENNFVQAMQWDGTEDGAEIICEKMGILLGGRDHFFLNGEWSHGFIAKKNTFIIRRDDELFYAVPEYFKEHYRPFSQAREDLLQSIIKPMRGALADKIFKGDDWL